MQSINSKDYWQKREREQLERYMKSEAEYSREIERIYKDMVDSVNKEINSFYAKYAKAEKITLAEAKKRVFNADIAEYERKAAKYVRDASLDRKANGGKTNKNGYYFSEQANEEMRLYNATMKINRLELLKANIGIELIKGHDEFEKYMADILQGRTQDELKRQAGILGKTIKNNAQKAHAIVNASFHNATFSDRIWLNQDIMREDLGKLIASGLIRGKNPRTLAKELEKYVMGDAKGGVKFNAERLMRTELARVQTEAQKQSFERNGFTEYEFIANSGCCDFCKSLDGKHFKVAKMMPGENAPPLHPFCRCSVAAWTDSEEYEEWIDYLDKGGTTKQWNNFKNISFLRNNLPKAYKDTRNVGEVISEKDLEEVIDYAKSKGVQIGTVDKPTGGFETYCGDKSVLKEVIDELAKQQNSSLFKKSGAKNAILLYDNVLGYDQYGNGIIDLSKIDIGAFASTKGRVITLNKFMFDDSKYLAKEYRKSANTGFFVKGTDYKYIVIHEIGHIIAKSSPGLANKILNVINKEARTKGISTHQYIVENISRYAAKLNGSFEYGELAAEINSLLTKNGNSDIIKLLIKEGVI